MIFSSCLGALVAEWKKLCHQMHENDFYGRHKKILRFFENIPIIGTSLRVHVWGGNKMLYIDKLVHAGSGLTFSFDGNWDIEDVYGLTDTHEKSSNWDDLDDGCWDQLILNEN
jgi:hypothetical protein